MKVVYIIIVIILISIVRINAQELNVKWDHKFVEDSMGINYISVVGSTIDKDDKLFVQLENAWQLPAYWYFSSDGDRIFYKNMYYAKNDTSFFGRVARLSFPMRSNVTKIEEGWDSNFFKIVTNGEANPNLNLSHLRVIEVPKNEEAALGTYLPLGNDKDILYDPITVIPYRPNEYLVFCNSKYTDSISRVHIQGQIRQQFPIKRDPILRQQNIIEANYDSKDSSLIWLLSGISSTNHQSLFPKDSIFGFQFRTFTVDPTQHSLIENKSVYFSESDLLHPSKNFYPTQFVVSDDKLYVVGNSRSKVIPKGSEYTDTKPFFAIINKDQTVDECKILDAPLTLQSICMSSDNSKMLFGGRRLVSEDSTNFYYESVIIEFDIASKLTQEVKISRIPYNKLRNISITSIDRYSNGDYSFTTWVDDSEADASVQSTYVTIGRLTRTTTSSGDNASLKTTVTISPNPSSEMATVEFMSSPEASLVQLVDIKGNVVRTLYKKESQNTHKSSVTFRVSDLANGMYYVVVGNGIKTLETVPLSIQR